MTIQPPRYIQDQDGNYNTSFIVRSFCPLVEGIKEMNSVIANIFSSTLVKWILQEIEVVTHHHLECGMSK